MCVQLWPKTYHKELISIIKVFWSMCYGTTFYGNELVCVWMITVKYVYLVDKIDVLLAECVKSLKKKLLCPNKNLREHSFQQAIYIIFMNLLAGMPV